MHFSGSLLCAVALTAAVSAQSYPPTKVPKGKAIQYVGHSFHVLVIPTPLATLAKEAKIEGHRSLGVDFIGASKVCQHWAKGGDTNAVKEILKAGKADVLTLSSQADPVEDCIGKFVKLAHTGKKDVRVMLQETWLPTRGETDRDQTTLPSLQSLHTGRETQYRNSMRKGLQSLNSELKTNISSMVPVWDSVLTLREMVVKGEIPGVAKQSSLFRDQLGHAQKPLADLVSYMWFGAIYGINPQGSKALAGGNQAQAAILQKLAWEKLTIEPLNGLNFAK